jgi:hypothetical protein
MEVEGYIEDDGRARFFDGNDARWFVKHEITKDKNGKEFIVDNGEYEWPPS